MNLKIRAIPNSPRSFCAGLRADAIKIKVAARAVDGKANAELLRFLAESLDLPKSAIRIARGESSRDKIVEIDGMEADEAKKKLLELNPDR